MRERRGFGLAAFVLESLHTFLGRPTLGFSFLGILNLRNYGRFNSHLWRRDRRQFQNRYNPYCPVDQMPLFIARTVAATRMHGVHDILQCPKCRQEYPIRAASSV